MKNDLIWRQDAIRVIQDSILDLEYRTENDELVEEICEIPVGIIHCEKCDHFRAYTENFKQRSVPREGADGDCYIRLLYSDDPRFNAVARCDFCSFAVLKREKNP